MSSKLTEEQYAAVLAALDEALAQGEWDASSFLVQIGKKLKKIRDDFAKTQVDDDLNRPDLPMDLERISTSHRAEMVKVFIALYAFNGENLQSWERVIANLPTQVISRPVYANEDDLLATLRTKTKSVNDAYVSVYIQPTDILERPTEKTSVDKSGKPLLSIKNSAVRLSNLTEFKHQSGTYSYVKGHLVRK